MFDTCPVRLLDRYEYWDFVAFRKLCRLVGCGDNEPAIVGDMVPSSVGTSVVCVWPPPASVVWVWFSREVGREFVAKVVRVSAVPGREPEIFLVSAKRK